MIVKDIIFRRLRVSAAVALAIFSPGLHALTAQALIDQKATKETKALYANLFRIAEQGFMFGHQDTDAYGVKWIGDANRSDVKDVTGSYPAVHGWDLGEIGQPNNIDGVPFDKMVEWIKATYQRGGVNTISWHQDNPLTGESTWSKGDAVKESLPGGKAHAQYRKDLDNLADFIAKCKVGNTAVPIIFRPLHEHNGDWFWWGKGIASEEDYIKLWRYTVDYLRNEKKLHNLIYSFSPDRSRIDMNDFKNSYLYAYPGDDYVDIIGYDNYWDVGSKYNQQSADVKRNDLVTGLKNISAIATEKRKVAALTETGLEAVTDPTWFTQVILEPIKSDPAIKLAYVMVWRNGREDHHYAPYKGHASEPDFITFFKDERTFFESHLQNMYQQNKNLIRK